MRLLVADVAQLVLGRRLGDEVVDAGLGGDGRRGDRIVAGDHHGLDAHAAQLGEALLDVGLDHVLEVDDAEQPAAVGERRAACRRSARSIDGGAERRRLGDVAAGLIARKFQDGVDRALAQLASADIDARRAASWPRTR